MWRWRTTRGGIFWRVVSPRGSRHLPACLFPYLLPLFFLLAKGTRPPSAAYRNAYTVLQREARTDAWSPGMSATTHRATPPDPTTSDSWIHGLDSGRTSLSSEHSFPQCHSAMVAPCVREPRQIYHGHAQLLSRYSLRSDLPTHRAHISNTIQKYGK